MLSHDKRKQMLLICVQLGLVLNVITDLTSLFKLLDKVGTALIEFVEEFF